MTDELATKPEAALAPSAPDYGALMAQAIEKGEDGVALLERIVALQERVEDRNALEQGRIAYIQASDEFPDIVKTRVGNEKHRQTKLTADGRRVTTGLYASLQDIDDAVRPVLSKHGFSIGWDRDVIDGTEYIVCIITHVKGYEKRSKFPAFTDSVTGKNQIQAVASGESYAKRYALLSVLGLVPEDMIDDDGNAAGGADTLSDEQGARVLELLGSIPDDDGYHTRFFTWALGERETFQERDVYEIRADLYEEAVQALEKTLETL